MFNRFLTVWINTIQAATLWEPLECFSPVFTQFHSSLLHLLQHGSLVTHTIVYQPSVSTFEEKQEHKRQKVARKQELAIVALQVIKQKESVGYIIVYTNGSAEHVEKFEWVGGWGCHSQDGWEMATRAPNHKPCRVKCSD